MNPGSQIAWGGRVAPPRAQAAVNARPSPTHVLELGRDGRLRIIPVGSAGLGLGQGSVGEKVVMSAPAIVGGVLTGVAASAATASAATVAAGGAASTAFLASSMAIPIIGAVVAGVTLGLLALFSRKGPKQKVATTEIVNKIEPLLKQNLDGYMAGPRTLSSQEQALENFKAGWQYVVDNCNVPVMGNPGQLCVSDRQRGGQWDWWAYYYDPIANDPKVKVDPTPEQVLSGGIDTMAASLGVPKGLLLAGAALLLAFTLGDGGRK